MEREPLPWGNKIDRVVQKIGWVIIVLMGLILAGNMIRFAIS